MRSATRGLPRIVHKMANVIELRTWGATRRCGLSRKRGQEMKTAGVVREESDRYARQILLFGEEGQEQLRKAQVLIAGAGGLGSPIAMYLAAAGVGHLVLVDRDTVDRSNLNRQLLHWEKDIGISKAISAEEKLRGQNPHIRIDSCRETLDESNADRLVRGSDVIVDATDNYASRYLLNRIAGCRGLPLVHGAIRGWSGQVTTIIPPNSACLRCIIPHPPPEEIFPVVGTTAGIVGTIQANEVLKLLLGVGNPLTDRLLIWDGLRSELESIATSRDPGCPDCGEGRGSGS